MSKRIRKKHNRKRKITKMELNDRDILVIQSDRAWTQHETAKLHGSLAEQYPGWQGLVLFLRAGENAAVIPPEMGRDMLAELRRLYEDGDSGAHQEPATT